MEKHPGCIHTLKNGKVMPAGECSLYPYVKHKSECNSFKRRYNKCNCGLAEALTTSNHS